MTESLEEMKKRAAKIYQILVKTYPDARCRLDFKTPFQLIVATILAAQCTDKLVNTVTPGLFRKYPDPRALAAGRTEDLEEMIKPTGFYHNKTKSLLGMAAKVDEDFGGKIPESMEELTSLPGVGRKTANVVRGAAYGKPAIIVDTHFKRVTARLGLTKNTDPDKIEADLVKLIPEEKQTMFSHAIAFHGINICKAPKPLCPKCPVIDMCTYPKKTV
jgi:endonuclease III